eukprot:GEMP01030260.1.p1 GENE.GEMP01030260.1~~GEMP01030260.1.p1  ORF type:complete len:213 (+),score=32.98 GEMP01030260.1:851-1489(+)
MSDADTPFYRQLSDSIDTPERFVTVLKAMSSKSSERVLRLLHLMIKDVPNQPNVYSQMRILVNVKTTEWASVWKHLKGTDKEKVSAILTTHDSPTILCSLLEEGVIGIDTVAEELPRFIEKFTFMVATYLAVLRLHTDLNEWWHLVDRVLQPPDNFHVLVSALAKLYDRQMVVGSTASYKVLHSYLEVDNESSVYLKALQALNIVGQDGKPL